MVGGRVAHVGVAGGGICDPLALANGIAVWVLITALRDRPRRASDVAQLGRGDRRRLIDGLVRSPLPWTGDEGYKKAEVTGGGVSLSDIDPATMESRRHRGLFLCGEMLDAFGPIGGYNFLWAWATGRAAGIGAARLRG